MEKTVEEIKKGLAYQFVLKEAENLAWINSNRDPYILSNPNFSTLSYPPFLEKYSLTKPESGNVMAMLMWEKVKYIVNEEEVLRAAIDLEKLGVPSLTESSLIQILYREMLYPDDRRSELPSGDAAEDLLAYLLGKSNR